MALSTAATIHTTVDTLFVLMPRSCARDAFSDEPRTAMPRELYRKKAASPAITRIVTSTVATCAPENRIGYHSKLSRSNGVWGGWLGSPARPFVGSFGIFS